MKRAKVKKTQRKFGMRRDVDSMGCHEEQQRRNDAARVRLLSREARRCGRCGPGHVRVTIRLDEDILNWLREQVNAAGGGNYQTLLNQALREYMNSCTRGQ